MKQAEDRFAQKYRSSMERLYAKSGAEKWRLPLPAFQAALSRSVARRFDGADPGEDATLRFLDSLHIEDLALAAACIAGSHEAWQFFIKEFRPIAEAIARSIMSDPGRARDAVDSLWADLYGLRDGASDRKCPLLHYHGRSSLKAWLRVVIARREVDEWRAARPTESLDAAHSCPMDGAGDHNGDPDRAQLLAALSTALHRAIAALQPRDRLRLSYYYVQELTLAAAAALLGEHESTMSRALARTRVEIRQAVERELRQADGLSDDQITRCFEYAVEDWPFDLGRVLQVK
ncbi:MAG TPA: sigma-70 family RNA polymerase sigma factor [Candidatus Binataceae bacterium]|nr:sigma-70 family RNA polymerase sigma factor [Candidatus Binataceae bacterium]